MAALRDARFAALVKQVHTALGAVKDVRRVCGRILNLQSSCSDWLSLRHSVAAMLDGWRPGTLNHVHTDPECPVDVLREPSQARRRHLLKVAGTDMGQCAAMVLRIGVE